MASYLTNDVPRLFGCRRTLLDPSLAVLSLGWIILPTLSECPSEHVLSCLIIHAYICVTMYVTMCRDKKFIFDQRFIPLVGIDGCCERDGL